MATTESRSVTEIDQGGSLYDGFISYSHAADDLLAPRLQTGLQRFAKPWWQRQALRIFRDESSLAANPHLWSSITGALDQSGWFILLLSPDAAESEWVNQETEYWLEHKDPNRIIPVVTAGEFGWSDGDVAGDSVPPTLAGVFADEPRWVDLRFARTEEHLDLNNASFRAAIADIASAIRQVPKDELESEEVRQHRRTTRTAWAAALALLLLGVVATGAAVYAVGQSNEAQAQRDEAERQTAVAEEQTLLAEEQTAEAEAQTEIAQEERDRAELFALETISARLITESEAARATEPDVASLLAVEAQRQIDIEVTRANLARGVLSAWGLSRIALPGNAVDGDMSPDGSWSVLAFNFGDNQGGSTTGGLNECVGCSVVISEMDLVTQRPGARRFERPGAVFPRVDLSADGSWLVVVYRDAATLLTEALVLDATTFQPIAQPIPGPVSVAAISPDGTLVAMARTGGSGVPLGSVDLVTIDGTTVRSLPSGDDGQVEGRMVFSDDGRFLVTAQRTSNAASLKVWEVATGRLLTRTGLGLVFLLGGPVISPDGLLAAVSSTGQGVTDASLSTSGIRVTVLDVDSGTEAAVVDLETFTPEGVSLHFGAGPVLAIGDASGVSLVSTETFDLTQRINDRMGAALDVWLGDADRTLLTVGSGIDMSRFDLTAPGAGSVDLPVTGITALSPVGDTIAVVGESGAISFWSARSGEQIGATQFVVEDAGAVGSFLNSIASIGGVPVFSSDGSKLYVRDRDGRFSVIDVSSGEVIAEIDLPVGRTHHALAVSGDSIATGHSDGTVMLWDGATFGESTESIATWQLTDRVGECAPPEKPTIDGIRRLRIEESADALEMIVVDQCDIGSVWVVSNGEPTLVTDFSSSGVLDFGPIQTYVRAPVSAGLQLFGNDGSEGSNFDGHRGPIRQTSLSHDGTIMASVSDDTIGLWYTASGELLGNGITGAQAYVADDGSFAVTSGGGGFDWFGGPVVVWDLDPEVLRERACESAGRNLSFFEWERFFPDEAYRLTCPQWPSGL